MISLEYDGDRADRVAASCHQSLGPQACPPEPRNLIMPLLNLTMPLLAVLLPAEDPTSHLEAILQIRHLVEDDLASLHSGGSVTAKRDRLPLDLVQMLEESFIHAQ
jgi:hypothetical protein